MIEIRGLKKSYGDRQALKGIDLLINKGEFYGLLGPNGAGKTTTISILSSVLIADSGSVTMGGFNLASHVKSIKKLIGVVPQEIALYNEFSAWENLMFWGGMYGVQKKELKQRAHDLLKVFGLEDRKNDAIKHYSGGMKRRINIAAALLHRPEILFMDEPTVGIDPQSRNLIFEVVEKLHREGMTIVYTTHYMEEAERFCDRIGIIDNGQIIAEGTLDELKKNSAVKEIITMVVADENEEKIQKLCDFWPDCDRMKNALYFYTSDIKSDLSKIVLECSRIGLEIANIEIIKTNLETIFLNLTGKQLRD